MTSPSAQGFAGALSWLGHALDFKEGCRSVLDFQILFRSFHKHLFFCRIFATEDVKEVFERVELHDGPGGASVFHDQTSKSGLIS